MENKPPLGVCPREIWEHERMVALSKAIYEYIDFGDLEPVNEWIKELKELLDKVGD